MENGELKTLDGDMPRLIGEGVADGSEELQGKDRVRFLSSHGSAGFSTEGIRGEVVECLERVEQCGRWPQHACTTVI